MLRHLTNDFLSEGSGFSGGADENMWLDALNHGEQIELFVFWPLAIFSGKVLLTRGELVFLGFQE